MSATGVMADRVVLVTGASGLLGAASVAQIRAAGGVAIATDRAPGAGIDHALDVTREADWQRVIAAIAEAHGRLDGLVNAAGIIHVGMLAETSFEDWRRVMAVNADGTFLGCKTAWPLLRKSAGASIVNLSSVSGLSGHARLAAYTASKGAVRLLTKSVALEGARLDPPIRCNSVHPGFVEGPMVDQIAQALRDPGTAHERMRAGIPMRRFAQADEVAAAVVHLLSPASSFTTGAELVIDGGLTA
ncbi:SDR family oxidoreductase [Limibaculum sp. M0105]|uniref:SDR family oxidoreductase n=1 Tax=Thermohalobaculum xanthum TaxID=2753746 RepID=A0A8J7MA04_9RHOB|nr:SDR family oxidoreductase [Thermohalobaculum xanthum]MBK0401099.1 SDR family oxidoreductase [Thermohalobaculum xanthum]